MVKDVTGNSVKRARRTPPGPKPRFSREDLVDVALRILSTEGRDRLSLRRLATEVGLTAAALYGYFGSKDDLESALVARVMPEPPADGIDPSASWQDQLRDYLLEIHDAIARQPGVAQFFVSRATEDPQTNRIREYLLELLFAGGFAGEEAVAALGTLSRYVLGSVFITDGQRGEEMTRTAGQLSTSRTEFAVLRDLGGTYERRNSMEATRYGLDATILGLEAMRGRLPHTQ
jgi:AcrR family transcriptional regulator